MSAEFYDTKYINKIVVVISSIAVLFGGIIQYFYNYSIAESLIIFCYGIIIYGISWSIYNRNNESKIFRYVNLHGSFIFIYIICYLENGIVDNVFYLFLVLAGSSIYYDKNLSISLGVHVSALSTILFILAKDSFFPELTVSNFAQLCLVLILVSALLAFQGDWGSKQIKLRMNLYNKSITDTLTQIYNRLFLDEYLETSILQANRYNKSLSLAMIDIDKFKDFNDKYGHPTGDIVLQKVSEVIKKMIRTSDVVARYGGEEFVVVFPGTDLNGAKIACEKIRKSTEEYILIGNNNEELKVTISIGVAQLNNNDDKTSIIERADNAMYKAKNAGRNKVECI